MRELKLNIFGLRKMVFSRFENQLLVVIYTRDNIKIKKFYSPLLAHWRKALIGVCCLTVLGCVSLTASIIGSYSSDHEEVTDLTGDEDEKLKESILSSKDSDYSEPERDHDLKISSYTVKKGDTLSEIAKEHGVSVETICGSSALVSYDVIHEGQVLKIPNKEGILVKVKKGETIAAIAKRYKVSADKIRNDNPRASVVLTAGMELFVPDAKPLNIVSGFIWPVSSHRITSRFGWRTHPLAGGRHFHTGIDIKAVYQNVRASKYGKVTYAGWMGGYGNAIIVAHPDGNKTLYGHLSNIWVKRGQYVKQGQNIARSGNTGLSTGPHLHFEIIKRGAHVNPLKFLHR